MTARAAILGCAGPALSAEEAAFFADADPWGFIVFARNVESPEQLSALTASLREAVGRDAPVFVDQEGGRVQRLRPPHWRAAPPAALFGALYARDPEAGLAATRLNHRLLAHELRAVGLDADCAPCLDLCVKDADPIIGDRAYGADPEAVAALGRAALEGLHAGGVAGVIKHIPGHGRADVDSHEKLPVVPADAAALAQDTAAFRALADAEMAMTAHVVYAAWDADHPATTSSAVIAKVIRGAIGFDGLLMSDDLSMKALSGAMRARAEAAFAAGCDMALHCNGDRAEMEAVVAAAPRLEGEASRRADAAAAVRKPPAPPEPFNAEAGRAELARLLAPVAKAADA